MDLQRLGQRNSLATVAHRLPWLCDHWKESGRGVWSFVCVQIKILTGPFGLSAHGRQIVLSVFRSLTCLRSLKSWVSSLNIGTGFLGFFSEVFKTLRNMIFNFFCTPTEFDELCILKGGFRPIKTRGVNIQYLTGHLYAKKSFALSHHFKAAIYSSFCTKGCTSTLRLYVLNFVANECNLVVQFAIYWSRGKNGKNGSPVHR